MVELEWSPKVIRTVASNSPVILPDSLVQSSSDLANWNTVHRAPGGLISTSPPPSLSVTTTRDGPRRFYRLQTMVNLPGADLHGANLDSVDLAGANLQGANLQEAGLQQAILREADLQQANLAFADLCYADLNGANLTNADLTGAILLSTVMPRGGVATDDPDAELLALETSGEFLAPRQLYLRIRQDLKRIRAAFPVVADIHHLARWVPGEVLARVTEADLLQLNQSEFGPVTLGGTFSGWSELFFKKHYHPVALTSLLRTRFGIEEVEPNYRLGDGNDIQYDAAHFFYTFRRGWGDCPAGCLRQHFWVFSVTESGAVMLVGEFGDPLP